MENGILSQVAAEDDDGDQPYEAGQMDGLSQQSQQSLNMSQLEHYADGMKPDEADSPVPDSAAIDEEVISITHKQESVPEPVPPVPEPVPEPSQTRVSTRRSAAASAASTTNDTVTPIKVDHSCTSSDAAAAIARQTPLHEKAMCLDSINAMLSAAQEADEVEIIDNAARQNAGILYCDETITEKTTLREFTNLYNGPPPHYDESSFNEHAPMYEQYGEQIYGAQEVTMPPTTRGKNSSRPISSYPNPRSRQNPPPRSRKGKNLTGKNPTGLAGSGTAKAKKYITTAEPPAGSELVPNEILRNASDSNVLELALKDHRAKKHLLLDMALSRDNPRMAMHDPKPGIITDGFFWGNYPALEKVLRNSMDEYYELSTAKRQSKEQQQFNNRLVQDIRFAASQNGWDFDPQSFDDKKIRDRIRCFFKTHIQNAKKRLKTVLKNQHKKSNSELIELAREAVSQVVGASLSNGISAPKSKSKSKKRSTASSSAAVTSSALEPTHRNTKRSRSTKVSSLASVSSSSSSSSYTSSKKGAASTVSLAYSYVPPSPVNVPVIPKTSKRSMRGNPIPDPAQDHVDAAAVMALGFGQNMSEMSQEVVGDA